MRRILLALSLVISSGMSHAAEILIDPAVALEALGLDGLQTEVLPVLPVVDIQIPLPAEINAALPTIYGKRDGTLVFERGRAPSFPQLPGLSAVTGLEMDVELPGLDGLPIQSAKNINTDVPPIPGFDGLPLGFGR